MSITVTIETITPDKARALLAHNTRNRGLDDKRVATYAKAMAAGEWDVHSQIALDDDDTVLDGQHRLHAVVKAGVPIQFVVLRGVETQAQETMDRVKPRSIGDILGIRGEANARKLAAAMGVVGRIEAGAERSRSHTETTRQALAVLDRHPDLRYYINGGHEWAIRSIGCGIPNSVLAALRYLFSLVDVDDAEAFFGRLASGANLADGDPILALRQRLEVAGRASTRRPEPMVIAAWVIKAWNIWRRGETCKLIRWSPGGASPEAYPKIDGLAEVLATRAEAVTA